MKKLIIIADSDPRCRIVGGVGTYATSLAEKLVDKFDILFIAKKQKETPTKQTRYKVITSNQTPGESNIKFYLSLRKMSKTLSVDNETIIHAQRPDWLYAFKDKKCRKIVTLHGSHSKNMALKKGLMLRISYMLLEKKGLESADKIIAINHETANEFSLKYPRIKAKILTIPVGVDTTIFKPIAVDKARKILGLNDKKIKKIYLYVGRLSKEKNIPLMISNLGKDEKLLIVGIGDEEQILRELSKGKDVEFLGPKKPEELPAYYSSADALLLFSTHEGLPTVVLESLACGTPVIATPVGEIPRLINNGKNGFIVDTDFQKAMHSMNKTPAVSKICRDSVLKYDWEKIASRIINEAYR